MVFLVPDLEEYDAGSRRFLFPFEESAPGPFVATTGEVVERVRDLGALREEYAPAIAAFNNTYNRWHDGHAAERVVDYSSLRFDFGVTGKPMVFLVPDLERYQDTRGWLFDFEPTAPGPFARTTDDVIEALADLDRVRTDHAATYAAFRDTYLDLEDGLAGQRFVDQVLAPRGDA
jgi:CDP-glycerol glycerophosphotransferase (TagB/SpsB family)